MKLFKYPIFIIAILLIIISLFASYWISKRDKFNSDAGYFMPNLVEVINDIKVIEISNSKDSFIIEAKNEEWTIPSLSNYPVSKKKIKKFLLDLSEIKTIEKKTSNPDLFLRLGVKGVSEVESITTKISLLNNKKIVLESFLYGFTGKTEGLKKTRYVRKLDENQSWLVWDAIKLEQNTMNWASLKFLSLKTYRVKNVYIEDKDDKNKIHVYRDTYDEQNFKLKNTPKKYSLKNNYIPNQIASLLDGIVITNILYKSDINEGEIIKNITFETFDGLSTKLKLLSYNNKKYLIFESTFNIDIRKELGKDTPKIVGLPKMKAIIDVDKEVTFFNKNTVEWAFEINEDLSESMTKKLSDLIEKTKIKK